MVKFSIFIGLVIAFSSVSSFSQAKRTITDLDLQKYKESRLKAEKELNEDYARLGFRSPEERAKSDAAQEKALSELSAKLRSERISEEAAQAAQAAWTAYYRDAAALRNGSAVYLPQPSGTYFGYVYYQGRWRFNNIRRSYQQPGYYAGGQFWPTGTATPRRPLFVTPRHRRP